MTVTSKFGFWGGHDLRKRLSGLEEWVGSAAVCARTDPEPGNNPDCRSPWKRHKPAVRVLHHIKMTVLEEFTNLLVLSVRRKWGTKRQGKLKTAEWQDHRFGLPCRSVSSWATNCTEAKQRGYLSWQIHLPHRCWGTWVGRLGASPELSPLLEITRFQEELLSSTQPWARTQESIC